MSSPRYLNWPFFEDKHRTLARELDAWATQHVPHDHGPDVDAQCKSLVRSLYEGATEVQQLIIARELLKDAR